jgi:hypothetical protein
MGRVLSSAQAKVVWGLCLASCAVVIRAQNLSPLDAMEKAVRESLPPSWSIAERKEGEIPFGHHWCDDDKGVTGVLLIAVGPAPVPAKFLDATGTWSSRVVAKESLEIWIMPISYHDSATAALCFHRPIQPSAVASTRSSKLWARPAHRINSEVEFNAVLSQYRGIQWPESPSNDATRLSWPTWQRDLSSSVHTRQ